MHLHKKKKRKGVEKGRKLLVGVSFRNTGLALTDVLKADHFLKLVTVSAICQIMGHDNGVVAVQVQLLVDRHHAVPTPGVNGLHAFSGGLPEVYYDL